LGHKEVVTQDQNKNKFTIDINPKQSRPSRLHILLSRLRGGPYHQLYQIHMGRGWEGLHEIKNSHGGLLGVENLEKRKGKNISQTKEFNHCELFSHTLIYM